MREGEDERAVGAAGVTDQHRGHPREGLQKAHDGRIVGKRKRREERRHEGVLAKILVDPEVYDP
jgi:hypothetical protein